MKKLLLFLLLLLLIGCSPKETTIKGQYELVNKEHDEVIFNVNTTNDIWFYYGDYICTKVDYFADTYMCWQTDLYELKPIDEGE
jgi:hypothetical protein